MKWTSGGTAADARLGRPADGVASVRSLVQEATDSAHDRENMAAPDTPFDQEVCAVCGKATAGGPSFMRVYLKQGRLEFCTPSCATVFNVNSARFGAESRFPQNAALVNWTDTSPD